MILILVINYAILKNNIKNINNINNIKNIKKQTL